MNVNLYLYQGAQGKDRAILIEKMFVLFIILQLVMMQYGGRIGFNSGNIRLLLEDLSIVKPTIFPTVPRVLNRIYDKVKTKLLTFILCYAAHVFFGLLYLFSKRKFLQSKVMIL